MSRPTTAPFAIPAAERLDALEAKGKADEIKVGLLKRAAKYVLPTLLALVLGAASPQALEAAKLLLPALTAGE